LVIVDTSKVHSNVDFSGKRGLDKSTPIVIKIPKQEGTYSEFYNKHAKEQSCLLIPHHHLTKVFGICQLRDRPRINKPADNKDKVTPVQRESVEELESWLEGVI
jgi:hypothetical protein